MRAEQAARRRGTASTKNRALVSGGGAKPWRQKGTGRARAGSSRSPLWTGGGTVFGPQPRSYTFKVNRKEQRRALRSALSLHAQRGSLAILAEGAFSAPRTARAAELLEDWEPKVRRERPTLVVLTPQEGDAALSFRNLARVAVLTAEDVGVSDLLGAATRGRLRARDRAAARPHRRSPPRPASGGELMDATQVIIRPVVSEKSYVLAALDRYTFRVHADAHKTHIRQAVESLFDVHVVDVRTMSVKGKPKRRGTTPRGSTRRWKKAIVQIRSGESIPVFQGLAALEE